MGDSSKIHRTKVETHVLIGDMSYHESLLINGGAATAEELSPETEGGTEFFRLSDSNRQASIDAMGAAWGGAFPEGIFKVRVDSSGWEYDSSWLKTKEDWAAYVIGIRELGIYSNSYVEQSEVVSKPWVTPRPIKRMALHTDQIIPKELTAIDPTRAWIEYAVSVDDGDSWYPIAPLSDVPNVSSSGARIPTIINVNSQRPEEDRISTQGYIDTDEPVTSARIRIRLTRPSGPDYEKLTPVLKKYRLKFSIVREPT